MKTSNGVSGSPIHCPESFYKDQIVVDSRVVTVNMFVITRNVAGDAVGAKKIF
jgi:hypothetical protein